MDKALEKTLERAKLMITLRNGIEKSGVVISTHKKTGTVHSIGASRYGFPDIFVTDLDKKAASHIIVTVLQDWIDNGYRDGRVLGLFESNLEDGKDMPVYIMPVDITPDIINERAKILHEFYVTEPSFVHPKHKVRIVQAFAPDANGKTQQEAGFDFTFHQTPISEPILTA